MSALTRPRRVLVAVLILVFIVLFARRDNSSREREGSVEVLNSTLGFQEIFVVNLVERTDRRDAMTLAAAVTDLSFTFVPGVRGADVAEKVLPPSERSKNENWVGKTGSWRAHMNVLQRIVHENITSALIMEDDADWATDLKSQARSLSLATQSYLQPLRRSPSHSLSTLHARAPSLDDENPVIALRSTPAVLPPRTSPYGDDWDVLWLGHVGSHLPTESVPSGVEPRSFLTLFVANDDTVPAPHRLKRHPFAKDPDRFASAFPPHTRVVHAARGNAGIQAYAVSQRGARKLLHRFGLEEFGASYDLMLRDWCDGVGGGHEMEEGRKGEGGPVCVTTQPPIFSQWYSSGGSDIHGIGGGYFRGTGSTYIRRSVMLNLRRLVAGKGASEGLVDQWPDEGKGAW
ncbi:uncharacterized protein DNG_06301 [Cephalotrichum gorgonifer]|uniref:Glycosyl transferase family 25 domain-containing protein n=1 Tax=Cephalotrichum gorgonifer TaxID=2041049 RepID=A0AAE8N1B9_9PEZI|nr:uncharacterized protein DNG_06301 [Cephalotrichum gorgonifer]